MIVEQDDREDEAEGRLGELERRDPGDPGDPDRPVIGHVADDRHHDSGVDDTGPGRCPDRTPFRVWQAEEQDRQRNDAGEGDTPRGHRPASDPACQSAPGRVTGTRTEHTRQNQEIAVKRSGSAIRGATAREYENGHTHHRDHRANPPDSSWPRTLHDEPEESGENG